MNPSELEQPQYHNPSVGSGESGSHSSLNESLFVMLADSVLMNCGDSHIRTTPAQNPVNRIPSHQGRAMNTTQGPTEGINNVETTSPRVDDDFARGGPEYCSPKSIQRPIRGCNAGDKSAARCIARGSMEDSMDRDLDRNVDLVAACQEHEEHESKNCQGNDAMHAAALEEIEGILSLPPTLACLVRQKDATNTRETSTNQGEDECIHSVSLPEPAPAPVHVTLTAMKGNLPSPSPAANAAPGNTPQRTEEVAKQLVPEDPLLDHDASARESGYENGNGAKATITTEAKEVTVTHLAPLTTALCTGTELEQCQINRYLAEMISEELLRTKSMVRSFKSVAIQLQKSCTAGGQPIVPETFRYQSRLAVVRQQSGLSENIISEAQVFASGTDTNMASSARALEEALRDAESSEHQQLENLATRMARLRCQALEYRLVSVKSKLSTLVEEQTAKLSLALKLSGDESSRLREFLREKQTAIMIAADIAPPMCFNILAPHKSTKLFTTNSNAGKRACTPVLPVSAPISPVAPGLREGHRRPRGRRRHRSRRSRSENKQEQALHPPSPVRETMQQARQRQVAPSEAVAKVEGDMTMCPSSSEGGVSSSPKFPSLQQKNQERRLRLLFLRLKQQWSDKRQQLKAKKKLKRDHADTRDRGQGVNSKRKRPIPTIDNDAGSRQTKAKEQKR